MAPRAFSTETIQHGSNTRATRPRSSIIDWLAIFFVSLCCSHLGPHPACLCLLAPISQSISQSIKRRSIQLCKELVRSISINEATSSILHSDDDNNSNSIFDQ